MFYYRITKLLHREFAPHDRVTLHEKNRLRDMTLCRRVAFIIVLLVVVAVSGLAQTVGLVLDGSHDAHEAIIETLRDELGETGAPTILTTERLLDRSAEEAVRTVAAFAEDGDFDAIVALGSWSTIALSDAEIPAALPSVGVIYGAVTDGVGADLSRRIVVSLNLSDEIEMVEGDLPVEVTSILVDRRLEPITAIPDTGRQRLVPIDVEGPDLTGLSPGAVYVLPLPHVDPAARTRLFGELARDGFVSVAADGRDAITRGALAGYKPDQTSRIAREIALAVDELVRGTPTAVTSSNVSAIPRLTINTDTLRAVRLSVRWDTVLNAEFVTPDGAPEREIPSLARAIEQALANNADLAAFRSATEAQSTALDIALSALLPTVAASARFAAIDEDRAESAATPFQYEGAVGARVEQVLWSEEAWAAVRVQRLLTTAQNLTLLSVRADTALETAEAYYNLVRAVGLVQIRREAVTRTRANLDRARLLERIGQETAANIFRFESQLAQDNQALIDAITQARGAMLTLNRLRGVPDPDPAFIASIGRVPPLTVPLATTERLVENFSTLGGVTLLERFAVDSALERSELLAARGATVAARERELQSARRRFFSPTVAAFGEVSRTIYEAGEGEGTVIELSPGFSIDSGALSTADETDWSGGVSVTLPLYTGQERLARTRRARSSLDQAIHERVGVALALEEYARFSVTALVAAFNKLAEARAAEGAARQGLALVEEGYERGAFTSVELLDAQNNAAIAAQQTGTVQAGFQTAWARLLHVTGWVDALISTERAGEFLTGVSTVLESER